MQAKRRRLWVEHLECREVPATAVLSGGVLTVTGTAAADAITIRQSAKQLIVDGAGGFALGGIKRVAVNGLAGNDMIDVRGVTKPVAVNGGAGADRFLVDPLGPVSLPGYEAADRLEFSTSGRVLKSAVSPNGNLLTLGTDGWLSVSGRRSWVSRDFAVGPAGTLYSLGANGALQELAGGVWRTISTSAQEFALSGGNLIWREADQGRLFMRPAAGGTSQRLASTVDHFLVASDGTLYWTEGGTAGRLYMMPPGANYRLLTSTVDRFQAAPDGTLYWTEGGAAGRLYSKPVGGNYRLLTSTVSQFQVAANGTVFWTEGGSAGRLYMMPAGADYRQISSSVGQFQVTANNTLYWTEGGSAGRMYVMPAGGNYRLLTSTVSRFQVDPFGIVYWTEGGSAGRLYTMPEGGNYRLLTSTVSRFEMSSYGTLYWTEGGSAGRLYTMAPGENYRLLTSTVDRFQVAANGTLFWTEGGAAGRLYMMRIGADYRQLSSTVGQFQVDANNTLYWTEGGSAGRMYVMPAGGNYRLLDTEVASFSITSTGGLHVQSQRRGASIPLWNGQRTAITSRDPQAQYNPTRWAEDGYRYTHIKQGDAGICTIASALASAAAQGLDLASRIRYAGGTSYDVLLYEHGWQRVSFDGRVYAWDLQPTITQITTADGRTVNRVANYWPLLFARAYLQAKGVNWASAPGSDDKYWENGFLFFRPAWTSSKNANYAIAGGDKNNWDTSEGSRAIGHVQSNLRLGSVITVSTLNPAYGGSPSRWNWLDRSIGTGHMWAVIGLWRDSSAGGGWRVRLYNPWGQERVLAWNVFAGGFDTITMVTRAGVRY